jgi:NAD(P)-dependent dehydrogenase (short-subunit alcohol dehydrogenase family)
MKLEGSIALVTGANRGLGAALVASLVEAGAARVYAAARDPRTLASRGPRVVPLALDLTRPDTIAAAAAEAGDVTILVNNAGVMGSGSVLAASPAAIEADFRTNVHGTLAVVRAFVPALERAGAGAAIVNVLSLAALASLPSMGGYAASKAAAYSITQALRSELRVRRVAVHAVLAGPIDTDMVRALTLPKAHPAEVAQEILAAVTRGDEDIFPDPMAREMSALWSQGPKQLERAFASF